MYVQSHARLWIINDYDDIFHIRILPSTSFLSSKGTKKKKKISQLLSSRRDNRKIRCCATPMLLHSRFISTTYYPARNTRNVTFPIGGKVKQRSRRSSSRINDARRRCNRAPLRLRFGSQTSSWIVQYP